MAKEREDLNLLIAANQAVKKDLRPWKYVFLTFLFTNLENISNLLGSNDRLVSKYTNFSGYSLHLL